MECSICFEHLEPSKFVQGLKNKNIDICKNGFKCLDQICKSCIFSYSIKICKTKNDNSLRSCPFCRSKGFEILCVMQYIYFNLKKINHINGMFVKNIRIDYENDDICYLSFKNSMSIQNRISLVLMTLFEDFKNEVDNLQKVINEEKGITFMMEELIVEIHELIGIVKEFSEKIRYDKYKCAKYNVLEDICKLYD